MLSGNPDYDAVNLVSRRFPRLFDTGDNRLRRTVNVYNNTFADSLGWTLTEADDMYLTGTIDFSNYGANLCGSNIESDYAVPGPHFKEPLPPAVLAKHFALSCLPSTAVVFWPSNRLCHREVNERSTAK